MILPDIDDLVPHRGDMSWLDRILEVDAESVVAEAVIRPDTFCVDNGQAPAWAGIEYMAQAVAAWEGNRARLEQRPVDLGFLVGTRRYESTVQGFAIGARLRIEGRCELMGDNGLGMFACRVLVDGDCVASANLSVFAPRNGLTFVKGLEGTP
ncbi:MAG TPA: hypothetical protein H9903_19960 [Candidatus Aquabacterium excrementipullorum]|nr:hypothetical protein [Candidatus Aquabacterium excrementipullorum]